jgi:hypothetical protein
MIKIYKSDKILRATPIQIEEGMKPYRRVLRNVGGYMPFVVHYEAMKLVGDTWESDSFYWGHYFTNIKAAQEAFEKKNA